MSLHTVTTVKSFRSISRQMEFGCMVMMIGTSGRVSMGSKACLEQ
jgi:hypothetical protein